MLFSYTGTPTSAPSVWPNSGSKKEWHSHPDARLLVHASPGVSEDDADDTLNLIGSRFAMLVLIRSSTVLRSVPSHAELHGWGWDALPRSCSVVVLVVDGRRWGGRMA